MLHEVLARPQATNLRALAGLRVRVNSDGFRSRQPPSEKYARDADVLRRALEAEPDNTRYAFYLAQSLRDAGQLSDAAVAYEHRAAMGGWPEEIYYARWQAAVLRERSGGSYADVVVGYLDAVNFAPMRAEALCDFARYLRENGRYALARQFAQAASRLPPPPGALILDSTVYDWRARAELAVACHFLGDRAESMRLWRELITDTRVPAHERERMQRNLAAASTAAPVT